TRRVELGDDGRAYARRGLERGTHPCAAGADDHDVVLVGLHRGRCLPGLWGRQAAVQNDGRRSAAAPVGHGSNVKITSVPRTTTTMNARYSATLSASRNPSRSA